MKEEQRDDGMDIAVLNGEKEKTLIKSVVIKLNITASIQIVQCTLFFSQVKTKCQKLRSSKLREMYEF